MAVIQVRVKPNARESRLEAAPEGGYIAHVKAPPVDGQANAELLALVARHFGCAESSVRIRFGAGGRGKLVEVDGA